MTPSISGCTQSFDVYKIVLTLNVMLKLRCTSNKLDVLHPVNDCSYIRVNVMHKCSCPDTNLRLA